MRLYDYTEAYVQLEQMLENEEITLETFQDTLEGIEGSAVEKAENVAKMVDNFNAQIEAFKAEEKKLREKRKTIENRMDWLMANLEAFHKVSGVKQAGIYKLGYRNLPDTVEVLDVDKLPDAYVRIKKEPDKVTLKKVLKDGELIPGAYLETGRKKFYIKK